MIDLPTLVRNLKDCIQQFPARGRHLDRNFTVWQNATSDMVQALDGGTRDEMSMVIIAARSDFGDRLPKSMDDFFLLLGDSGESQWIKFQVKDVPDFWDAFSPMVTINLQSPNKGIM